VKPTPEELSEILSKHALWARCQVGGARANLTGADLTGADLTRANLTDANLTRENLTGADLTGADLTGADLTRADLTGADLTDANLTGANLTRANLTRADLTAIQEDLYDVLWHAKHEAPALLSALNAGRVDGSTYEGPCACLVGTIAAASGCSYRTMAGVQPNASRPAERWFLAILPGHTPETCPITKITADWVSSWIAANPVAS
jgi:uncharacterized protein YjbI with pentapeptide repeats